MNLIPSTAHRPANTIRHVYTACTSRLRSNGRKVTFDEALQLVPPDPTELLEVVEAFQNEVDKIKKKEESKAQMKAFSSR